MARWIDNLTHSSLYFVYIGVARFVLTYVYTTLFTKVAYHFTRNIRRAYLQSALSQDISYFDLGSGGSIAMQGNSNGKLIQSGVAEKRGLSVQAITTFVTAFIIALINFQRVTIPLLDREEEFFPVARKNVLQLLAASFQSPRFFYWTKLQVRLIHTPRASFSKLWTRLFKIGLQLLLPTS